MKSYSISDLAREFDLTTRTIRHYECEGLLTPQHDGMTRLFSSRDRGRLKVALRAKRLGFSLAEIRELFNLYDTVRDEKRELQPFLEQLERRRALLVQRREDIEVMLNEISFFEQQCRKLAQPQPASNATSGARP